MVDQQPTTNNHQQRRSLRQRWSALNDWLKALLIAFVMLAIAHVFILRWVTVRSTSMYATLLPGDLVGVARWPVWTGFHRGDIAVFHDPIQDDRAMARRQLLVKRIVGLPGDVVELRDGKLFVNNKRVDDVPQETKSWLVRLKHSADPQALLREMGLPPAFVLPDGDEVELPLNMAMAAALRERPDIVSAEPMRLDHGSPGHIFPFSPNYPWNSDDYGPIIVPHKGDHVRVDVSTLPLFDRIITRYEGNKLEAAQNEVCINGAETHSYVVQQDYYFVLGDSRHYSEDSRHWGFVPGDHLVGRAAFALLSSDPANGAVRGDRWCTRLE